MEKISGIAACKYIIYNKENFTIARFKVEGISEEIVVKGAYVVEVGSEYKISAIPSDNKDYQDTYVMTHCAYNIDLAKATKPEIQAFLSKITSKRLAENIVNTLADPVSVITSGDISTLVEVKGVGVATAERLIDAFEDQKDNSAAYIAFAKYNFSEKLINKIVKHFGGADVAISIIEKDIYSLVDVNGIGFKKADTLFLACDKGKPSDIRRVQAYVNYMFEKMFEDGDTWMSPKDFVISFQEDMPAANVEDAISYINKSDKYISYEFNGEKRIALKHVYNLECEVAKQLYRIMSHESDIKIENRTALIEDIERSQGWKYDDTQREVINQLFDENVVITQGLAGTGKSSTVNAFSNTVIRNGYQVCQSALSGRAASNLGDITGIKSKTIHLLLDRDHATGGFLYKESNPLPYDVIILDEFSMVDLKMFIHLLKAIRNGAKLVILGDHGQLEAIGVSVMKPVVDSKKIPCKVLTKIHRQAEKSAVITHARAFREGKLPKEVELKPKTARVYGELKDMQYVVLDDNETIKVDVLLAIRVVYQELLKKNPVKDIQIVTQTKTNGAASAYDINTLCQGIANPLKDGMVEIPNHDNDNSYMIRVGDRIINTKNKYGMKTVDDKDVSIFNGYMGTVVEVNPMDRSIIVDFDSAGKVSISKDMLKQIELGYAITVHKSQGSTIPIVIYALMFNFMMNSRELLYTGVTRTATKCFLITTPRAIKNCLKKSSRVTHRTSIKEILENGEQ